MGKPIPIPSFFREHIMNVQTLREAPGLVSRTETDDRHHLPSPTGLEIDPGLVVRRLEEAGRTLLALPGSGYSTRLRTSRLDIAAEVGEVLEAAAGRVRAAAPDAAQITRMDEALGWLSLIPQDRFVLRRIVGARSLISPVTDRHLFSWRRLGSVMGADHKAVQRWHGQGIGVLVMALRGRCLVHAG